MNWGWGATNKALRGAVLIVKKLVSRGALMQSTRSLPRERFSVSSAPGTVKEPYKNCVFAYLCVNCATFWFIRVF